MSFVVLEKVVKRYGALEVVHGIDLAIEPEEFVVLVGPSGCGKSTTLRMIAGLEEISAGTITLDGRVINSVPPKDRDVAMVFQNYALYPHLNVFNNICFGLKLRGAPKRDIARLVEEAAQILGLTEYLARKPSDLSGGQRQRVAMGRAIVRNPKVFLFDEPLSNLDAKLRTQMRAEIKRLHQRLRTTIIYVTHDQTEAMTLADRIVVMRDGYIEQVGRPLDLFLKPANTFVAGFIGTPPMNLISGVVRAVEGRLGVTINELTHVPLPERAGAHVADGQLVVLGVRAEDMSPVPPANSSSGAIGCEVDLVEPLGSETLVHLKVGDCAMIAKAEGRSEPGHLMGVRQMYVNSEHVHLFHAETRQALM